MTYKFLEASNIVKWYLKTLAINVENDAMSGQDHVTVLNLSVFATRHRQFVSCLNNGGLHCVLLTCCLHKRFVCSEVSGRLPPAGTSWVHLHQTSSPSFHRR